MSMRQMMKLGLQRNESGIGLLQAMFFAGIVATISYVTFDYFIHSGRRLQFLVDRSKYIDLASGRGQYLGNPHIGIDSTTLLLTDPQP